MARILHVLNDLSTFHTHRQSLIEDLRKLHEVVILAPAHLDHSGLKQMGYEVRGYPLSRKGLNPFAELATLQALRQIYRELRPDLVHHFTIKPVIYGSLAARQAGIKRVINTITGLGYVFTGSGLIPELLKPVVSLLYRFAFRGANVQVIFQNRDDQQLFLQAGLVRPEQAHLILGSGVNTQKFSFVPEPAAPPYRVVLPARMLWDKGIGEFVEAARLVRLQRSDVEFELVGALDPGNRMAIPEKTLQEWQRAGIIKWHGRRENMVEVYHQCHIVCLPSYREGVPMALLEAMSCGKAIVTTDVPGCRELIKNNIEGLVVEVKNPRALAEAFLLLLDNPLRRQQYNNTCRAISQKNYSKELVNQKVNDLYLISGK